MPVHNLGTKRQSSFSCLMKTGIKIFVNIIKSKTAQTCTLTSAASYSDCSKNIDSSKQ